jgi:hypothetical protein
MDPHPEATGATRRPEVLLLMRAGKGPRALVRGLTVSGYDIDITDDAERAVALFYERGGHAACVLGDGPPPAATDTVLRTLRAIDRSLPVVAHPEVMAHLQGTEGVTALGPYHLYSRAGISGVVRSLRALLGQ